MVRPSKKTLGHCILWCLVVLSTVARDVAAAGGTQRVKENAPVASAARALTSQASRMARVVGEEVYLHPVPSREVVAKGTIVKVLDEQLSGYIVRYGDKVGWMPSDALQFVEAKDAVDDGHQVPASSSDSSSEPSSSTRVEDTKTRSAPTSDKTFIRGPRGGCYRYSKSGRKVYVDRSLCD